MPLEMVRNDITKMKVDAIVNAANRSLLGGGGVDGAIHRAAGPKLLEECRTLGGCNTGEAKITAGYRLPAKYVIHTVGPVWHGGQNHEKELLASCYRNSLELALENKCGSLAFPLISAGAYGYPKDQAISVAVECISSFLLEHDMTVYLVVFGRTELMTGKKLFRDVQEYIDDVYAETHVKKNVQYSRKLLWEQDEDAALQFDREYRETTPSRPFSSPGAPVFGSSAPSSVPDMAPGPDMAAGPGKASGARRAEKAAKKKEAAGAGEKEKAKAEKMPPLNALKRLLNRTDEGFSEALLRMIDEKGMTDSECYKKANVDRKLFSKIRSNPAYRPSKPTVCAFAVALELSLPEAQNFLKKAGFALSHSSKFDIILEYFLLNRYYDIYEINMVLFEFDMPLLGSGMSM